MALVRLLSALKKKSNNLSCTFILTLWLGLLSTAASAQVHEFDSFSDLRKFLLNEIGGAKKRIWLVSDFLSDGETVSSLYVAKYRGLDVAVLLGRAKARAYMSRLRYLKRQNIPASLKPQNFPLPDPTLILIDEQLFRIDGELNFLDQQRAFRAVVAQDAVYEDFQAAFLLARNNPEAAVAPPVPLVGKPRHNSSRFSKSTIPTEGAYNYDRHSRPKVVPDDVPRQLPQKTIYQKRGRTGHDAKSLAEQQRSQFNRDAAHVLNPITAREPIIWNPRSPESF